MRSWVSEIGDFTVQDRVTITLAMKYHNKPVSTINIRQVTMKDTTKDQSHDSLRLHRATPELSPLQTDIR